MAEDYSVSGKEPELQEVMSDPIVRMLMKSDGVSEGALRPLIKEVSAKVQEEDAA